MADIFSKKKRSNIMSKIHSRDTKPELIVRKYLFSRGFRYKLHNTQLPGRPDLVLPKYRSIVFVDGCFWHSHHCKIGSGNRIPASNSKYWKNKIKSNIKRDRVNRILLSRLGWNIYSIWECEALNLCKMKNKLNPLTKKRNF